MASIMASSESAFDEKLIEYVRLYPILYLSGKKSNKNKVAKENAWKVMADDLHTTAEECERRWRVLRDQYVKFLRAHKPSGSGVGGGFKKPAFADAISFIKDTIKHRTTKTNLTQKSTGEDEDVEDRTQSSSDDVEDLDDPHGSGSQSPSLVRGSDDQPTTKRKEPVSAAAVQPRPKVQRSKKASPKDLEMEVVQAIREVSAASRKTDTKPRDEHELYAESLVPQLRRLTPRQFAVFKAKVAAMLVEIEFGASETGGGSGQGVAYAGWGVNMPCSSNNMGNSYTTGMGTTGGGGGWGLGVGPSMHGSGAGWGMGGMSGSWGAGGIGGVGLGSGAGASNIGSQFHPWSAPGTRSGTPSFNNLISASSDSATSFSSILKANADIMIPKNYEERGDDQ